MRPVPRDAETPPKKNALTFFLSPIIFHQPIFAMYNNEPWKLPVAHTWGSWQSKQSYETSCISVWVSAAKPDRLYPIFGFNQVGLGPRVQKRVRYGWPQKGSIIGFNPMMQIMQHCSSSWMPFNFLFSLTLDFVLVFNCFNAITLVPKRLYVCKL